MIQTSGYSLLGPPLASTLDLVMGFALANGTSASVTQKGLYTGESCGSLGKPIVVTLCM